MLAIFNRVIYNVISDKGKVSLHFYKKKRGTGDIVMDLGYLLAMLSLGLVLICTYTKMVIAIDRNLETYNEVYTVYIDTEEGSFFVSSIDYNEIHDNYYIKYCYTRKDRPIRLPKYEAMLIVLWMNSLEDDKPFKLKKI